MKKPEFLHPILLIIAGIFLAGTMPGEMRGCETDISNEIDPREYCRLRCSRECEMKLNCGIIETYEDCYIECERKRNCDYPIICSEDDSFISENEAKKCIDDWKKLSCSDIERGGYPKSCSKDELCDPQE